ncbi:MAG: hypothetical protein M1820_002330 [Bogoriella megaspora]|nr:MAG: hypothetical protein M1820_002330 [Bogoriella megaspora]
MIFRSLSVAIPFSCLLYGGFTEGYGISKRNTTASDLCVSLQLQYPDLVNLPLSLTYIDQNQDYWNEQAWLGPACVVAPKSASDVSTFVKAFEAHQVPFAVKGGGHMAIVGSNNIDSSGIMISFVNLATKSLSADNQTASIGPGNIWADVYEFLEPYDLLVPGGRVGIVGVPGLSLGGGMSFLSGQHGWSSVSIKAYEVVLASGDIITATADNSYSDLFWALKGGGNSFGIVTRFDYQTYPAPVTWAGISTYTSDQYPQWLDAIYNFAEYGSIDYPNAAIIPISMYTPALSSEPYPSTILFNNGSDTTGLENFTAPKLTPTLSTFSQRSLSAWATEIDSGTAILHGDRERFHNIVAYNSPNASNIINDVYMSAAQEMLNAVNSLENALAIMPVSKDWVRVSDGKVPMGLSVDEAPYLIVEQSLTWALDIDDAAIESFIETVNQRLDAALEAEGLKSDFYYMNDADSGQPVFEGYGCDNVNRLQSIRDKYDPKKLFTTLLPGGWKVANVTSC